MKTILHNSWQTVLEHEFEQDYYLQLHQFLKEEYETRRIYPEMHHIFTAFEWTPFEEVKIVILGQDPYHGEGQAHGLSFSVQPGIAVPPSLGNIYKELENDLGFRPVSHGFLKKWAEQGVLMLNTILTVRSGEPLSHKHRGWEQFTNEAIEKLNERETPVIFILWGKVAQEKSKMIDLSRHYIIQSVHPSPLSSYRGFFGSKPFSTANKLLTRNNMSPIDWQLPEVPC